MLFASHTVTCAWTGGQIAWICAPDGQKSGFITHVLRHKGEIDGMRITGAVEDETGIKWDTEQCE